jgi:hypothetical protein
LAELSTLRTTVLPVIIGNQEAILTATDLLLAKHQKTHPLLATRVAVRREVFVSAPTDGVDTIARQQWMNSTPGWVGVCQRRTTKYLITPGPQHRKFSNAVDNIIEHRHETFFHWRFFRCGFYVSRQYLYESILPSLRISPIIGSFEQYDAMFQESSILE